MNKIANQARSKVVINLDGMSFVVQRINFELITVESSEGEGMITIDPIDDNQIILDDLSDVRITPSQKVALINLIQLQLRKWK